MRPTLRTDWNASRPNPFPRIILGTAALGGLRGAVDPEEAVLTILEGLQAGIGMIDTAPAYGNAEELVGEALKRWAGPPPKVSTKVGKFWKAGKSHYDYSRANVVSSVQLSCERIGLQSFDCVFAHEPDKMAQPAKAAFVRELEHLRRVGLARSLGLGGGHGESWDGLVETGAFSVAILHSRLDAITSDAVELDVPRLRRANMTVLGGSILHKGLLGNRTLEYLERRPPWLSPTDGSIVQRIQQLAEKTGQPVAALAHRFVLSTEEIDSVIIGPETRAQLQATLQALRDGPLPKDTFDAICACQSCGCR